MLGQVVLLITEEPQLRRLLRVTFNHHGARLLEYPTVQEALEPLEAHRADLVLLDLRARETAPATATLLVRERTDVPLFLLSDTDDLEQKIAAFDAGGDDYLTIPFSSRELLARTRAALRRALRVRARTRHDAFRVGELEVDFAAREVRLHGKAIHLTPTEYKLLGVLIASAGKVVTHQRLLQEVWGPTSVNQVQYLRVYMKQLRRKLEPAASLPQYLVTEPAVGYRLRLPA
jgi:two-component system, OmpR family, KDP operon response regulator KdpE